MRKWFLLAASIFIICCTPSLVSACTCGVWPGNCNQEWKSGEVIFTGKVTGKTTTSTPPNLFAQNAFQISVSESFRGSAIVGQDITVYTGSGGGDCGYAFKVGTSYLVYASLDNGKLVTNICTFTNPVAQMRAIIRQLRALQKGEAVADLFGTINIFPKESGDDPPDPKPLAGRRVRVISSRNVEQVTTTDDEGVFSFQDLPADTYRIEVDPPEKSDSNLNKGVPHKVDIGAHGQFGCPTSISFSPVERVKGK